MNIAMRLEDLGYTSDLEEYRLQQNLMDFEPGRVLSEHKERYIVGTEKGEFEAEITGKIRYTAESREDFPVAGDWVALNLYDSGPAVIHRIFPRFSLIKRQAVGNRGEVQVIAANVDYAFLVQALDRDFNLNRLERYLTVCYSSGVSSIIILTKTDLTEKSSVAEVLDTIRKRIKNVPVLALSNETLDGYDPLKKLLVKGKTYCMLGSSGVGKSTLINNLLAGNRMRTDTISLSTNKGRHVTSHRELVVLEEGGILIDNPGMREVGLADSAGGLEATFEPIARLSQECRFKNCTHTGETGCSVMAAVERGELDKNAYENYLKMERETAFFESSAAEKKRNEKIFGKILKDYTKINIKQRK